MTKTVSARIPNSLHDELRERCNLLGDPISDFVEAAIELILTGSTDYDFGDEMIAELENKKSEFEKNSKN